MPDTPPPPVHRTIIATVLALGPRKPDPAEQVFALSVSAGLDVPTAASPATRASVLPWRWQDPKLIAWATDAAGQKIACTVTPVPGAPRPSVVATELDRVRAWFDGSTDLRIARPDHELRGHTELPPTVGEQLAYLSTYPGDLPCRLGLIRYFTLKAEVPGTALVGHPIWATLVLDGNPLPDPDKLPAFTWANATGDLVTTVTIRPHDPTKPTTSGALGPDLTTYWIRVGVPTGVGDDLTARCREATSYFARMADFVRGRIAEDPARNLLLDALVAYSGAAPWATIRRLATAAGVSVPAGGPPDLTPRQIALRVLQLGDRPTIDTLLALPVSAPEDVLLWHWNAWGHAVPQPTLAEVLRDATLDADTKNPVRGAAALHRATATALASSIVAAKQNAAAARDATKRTIESALPALAGNRDWDAWSAAYGAQLWAQLDEHAERPPVAKPRGLTMQFDELVDKDLADRPLWDQLAGVGVLIRRRAARAAQWGPWRYLGGACVKHVRDGAQHPLFADEGPHPAVAVVPHRFHARDGVVYPFVTYEHRSLVASSPLDDYIGTRYGSSRPKRDHEARIAYSHPTARSRDLLLPPLVYGDGYQMAAFAIDLAGGLPSQISAGDQPFRARPFTWDADDGSGTGAFGLAREALDDVPGAKTDEMTYLREVPVGRVRVRRADLRRDPDVPEGIEPLARTLLRTPEPDKGPKPPPLPLIVRRGWDRSQGPLFDLRVELPTVDIDVLERWIGIAAAHEARVRQLSTVDPSRPVSDMPDDQGIAFVDPAVAAIIVNLEDVTEGTHIGSPERIPASAFATTDHRGTPISITARLGDTTSIMRTGNHGNDLVIAFPALNRPGATPDAPARVFRLTIDLELRVLDAADPVQRFAPGIAQESLVKASYELHVELASRAMPTPAQLDSWFAIDDAHDDRVIRPRLTAAADRALLRHVSHGQVLRHAWRWLGRPRPRWPFGGGWPTRKTFPARADIRTWELTAFFDLDPDGMRVPADTVGLPFGQLVPEPAGGDIPLLIDDWYDDKASQYLRYGVRMTSRYAPMFDNPAAATSASGKLVKGNIVPTWTSVFLPDVAGDAKAPVLMAWLPLTRHLDEGPEALERPTPVLVAFHGPVHRDHGISEGIVAQLATPHGEPALLEYGRDPINTASMWEPPRGASADLVLQGPYGFTFEPSSVDARFATTVYLLDPPFGMSEAESSRSLASDFAKVQFARLPAVPGAVTPDTEWTPAVWVHLGRAASALAPSNAVTADRRVILKGFQPAPGRWIYYVVVTRGVSPFGGAVVAEAYMLTARLSYAEGVGGWATPPLDLPAHATLYVRVLEVQAATLTHDPVADLPQVGPPPPEGEALWQALFPGLDEHGELREPHLRIVRISPRGSLVAPRANA